VHFVAAAVMRDYSQLEVYISQEFGLKLAIMFIEDISKRLLS